MAAKLVVEHPARVAWTMHLADMVGNTSNDPNLSGDLVLGGGFAVPLGRLGLFAQNPFVRPSVAGLGRGMNPMINIGVAATTGLSPRRGFKPVSEAGRAKGAPNSALIARPGALAQFSLKALIPQIQQLDAMFSPTNLPAEANLTKPLVSGYLKQNSRLGEIAAFLGVPYPEKIK
jgi:hypothetical protein